MNTYQELFRIAIAHPYYVSGRADLSIFPDQETRRLMQGRHFILKDTETGLRVLVPNDGNGIPAASSPAEILSFEIYPDSTHIGLITALPTLEAGEVLSYTNASLTATETTLVSGTTAGQGTRNGFPMLARVEVHLNDILLNQTEPIRYEVVFQAKSETWKYYFVSENETTLLSVEDRDENLVFNPVTLDANTSDTVGIALKTRFPEANVFLFRSATEIACSDQAVKNLQLLRDGHLIIRHLPNPEIGDAATKIIKI